MSAFSLTGIGIEAAPTSHERSPNVSEVSLTGRRIEVVLTAYAHGPNTLTFSSTGIDILADNDIAAYIHVGQNTL